MWIGNCSFCLIQVPANMPLWGPFGTNGGRKFEPTVGPITGVKCQAHVGQVWAAHIKQSGPQVGPIVVLQHAHRMPTL